MAKTFSEVELARAISLDQAARNQNVNERTCYTCWEEAQFPKSWPPFLSSDEEIFEFEKRVQLSKNLFIKTRVNNFTVERKMIVWIFSLNEMKVCQFFEEIVLFLKKEKKEFRRI